MAGEGEHSWEREDRFVQDERRVHGSGTWACTRLRVGGDTNPEGKREQVHLNQQPLREPTRSVLVARMHWWETA